MRIGVLGTGGMAEALAAHWVRAGHRVTVGGRDAGRARRLAERTGAAADGLRGAAAGAEAVLIDCSNPVGPGFRLLTEGGGSAARLLAGAAPEARVVKAFNLCHRDVWRMRPPVFDGRPLAVPLCGDDGAVALVAGLVRDTGCEPLPAGGLERAGLLEATAALFIGLWIGEGADVQAIAPPAAYAAGPPARS